MLLFRYLNMAAAENFAGIDFDEIKEATALEVDEIKVKNQISDIKMQIFFYSTL